METGDRETTNPTASSCSLSNHQRIELPDRTAHLIFWPTLLLGLALDLWTKHAVFAWLLNEHDQRGPIIDGFLTFQLALNDGAAFGIAEGKLPFLIGVSSLAMFIILGVFFFGAVKQRVVQVGAGALRGGRQRQSLGSHLQRREGAGFHRRGLLAGPALAHLQRGRRHAVHRGDSADSGDLRH